MTKRRDLVRLLLRNGFTPDGGTKHERFSHPDGREVTVPRHRELKALTARLILTQAKINERAGR